MADTLSRNCRSAAAIPYMQSRSMERLTIANRRRDANFVSQRHRRPVGQLSSVALYIRH
jgi:hypothetical protein